MKTPNTDSREADFLWKVYQEGLEAGFQEAHNKTSKDAGQVKQEAWAALEVYTANKQLEARIDELTWVLDKLIANDVHFPHTQVEIEDHIAKLKALGNTNYQ